MQPAGHQCIFGVKNIMEDDYIVKAMAAGQQLRVLAMTSRGLVESAREIHNTSPVATAALGRLLTAGSMMGSMMKGEHDLLTLQIQCSGPIGGLTVTADAQANVKGYVKQPTVLLPPNRQGKLDVAGALGAGFLNVIRDIGMKEPYIGQIELISGEIAEDLTYYYVTSEQVPSSVGLGVLLGRDNHVKQAGGFIIQVMPSAEEGVIDAVEEAVKNTHSVTALLGQGMSPEDMVHHIMGNLDVEILERVPAKYFCNCSKERVSRAIAGIGRKDLQEMVASGETIEVNCQFCGSHYYFTAEELAEFLK